MARRASAIGQGQAEPLPERAVVEDSPDPDAAPDTSSATESKSAAMTGRLEKKSFVERRASACVRCTMMEDGPDECLGGTPREPASWKRTEKPEGLTLAVDSEWTEPEDFFRGAAFAGATGRAGRR